MDDARLWRTTTEHLEHWCRVLGYSLEEIEQAVISHDGDAYVVDVVSGFFPKFPKDAGGSLLASSLPPVASSGPGTELSRLLKKFGIEPTPTCSCRAKAAQMDAWGCDECSKPERIEEVVGVMRAEAKARGLPFLDVAARLLVRRAIHNARKAEAARAREAERPPLHTEQ